MLSRDLLSLLCWFDAWRTGQHEMTAAGAEHFSRSLSACYEQAVKMESTALAAIEPSRGDAPEQAAEDMLRVARAMAHTANVVMLYADRPLWRDETPHGGAA